MSEDPMAPAGGAGSRKERAGWTSWPFIGLIAVYQWTLSPVMGLLGAQCRFSPTCSVYARDAYRLHGAWRGTGLMLRRLSRCHPWGGSGVDEVPPRDV